MLKVRYYKQFKKDYKRIVKRGYNKKLFEDGQVQEEHE